MASPDLALVGYEPPGSENLSLRLLAGAVTEAGLSAELFLAAGIAEAPLVTMRAVAAGPLAIGFSTPDAENAMHSLILAQLARRKGHRGYIVCGGPFATLEPQWILDRATAVDGIIRFDGEESLVALLNGLRRGSDLTEVPSLMTREHSNPPALNDRVLHWRPKRGPRPLVMGVPTATMIGGRGCQHHCDYCTHAAQASLVVRECREAGLSAQEIRSSGIGRPRRRSTADIVEEMAELYHADGVRYFQFIDELLLPGGEIGALAFLRELRDRFVRSRMDRVALNFMTRGDALSAPVVEALAEIGLVGTLVGVESGVEASLAALGRNGSVVRGRRGVRLLAERGVISMFNALLLHPDSTEDSIRAELTHLRSVRGALFDTVQVRPFPQTELHRRLDRQEQLAGGRILPTFSSDDEVVVRFQSLMARLQTKVLGRYTPTFRVYDLVLSATLAARFGSSRNTQRILTQLRELGDRINSSRLDALEALVDVAAHGGSARLVIERSATSFESLVADLDRLEKLLINGETGHQPARHYRNLAAAAAFAFAIATAPACYRGESNGDHDPPEDTAATDADSDADSDADADGDSDTDADTDTATDTSECADDEYWQELDSLNSLIHENCDYEFLQSPDVLVEIDGNGTVVEITIVGGSGETDGWQEELRECYLELLAGEEFPCLAGEEIWIYGALAGPPMF